MAKPRQKPSGKWEIALRHPQFADGRKYFTFDTQEEAEQYARQWKLMKEANLQPPAELLQPSRPAGGVRLARVLGEWEESGYAAPSQLLTLSTVTREVGGVKLADVDYTWLNGYLRTLKVDKNLSPISIKHRIQALGRAIDEYLRHHPELGLANPIKLLPRGYATYTDADKALAEASQLGYAGSYGEWHREIGSLATPVQGPNGEVMALNCGGPAFAFSAEHGQDGDSRRDWQDGLAALAVLQQGLVTSPSNAELRLLAARIMQAKGDHSGALSYLQAVSPSADKNLDFYALRAALAQQNGQFKDAVFSYRALTQAEPMTGRWWLGLGVAASQAVSLLTAQVFEVKLDTFHFVFSPAAAGKPSGSASRAATT